MTKMNPEVKAKWLAALRSGEYAQGKSRLRTSDGTQFCCLGVLCDVYANEHGKPKWKVSELEDENAAIPNETVGAWAGFPWADEGHTKDPYVTINGIKNRISTHNDDGRTFAEIADAIEAQL